MIRRDCNRLHGASFKFYTRKCQNERMTRESLEIKYASEKKKRIKLAITYLCKTDNSTEASALINRKRDIGLKVGISLPVSDTGTL